MSTCLLSAFFFDRHALQKLAEANHEQYINGEPFPHIIFDEFLPQDVADQLLQEFPDASEIAWSHHDHAHSKKLACNDEGLMGPTTRHIISQLNSGTFLTFLGHLTGIEGIMPDPYLMGGGLHQIERGGYLSVHADFNYSTKLRLDRRLNLLLYLNRNWPEDYGGHLELWNTDMTTCEKRIAPVFNRCVIFSTTDVSFHGHPEPLACPDNRTRKSLALYYYTNGMPGKEAPRGHRTIYRKTPGQESITFACRRFCENVMPPVVLNFLRYLSQRIL